MKGLIEKLSKSVYSLVLSDNIVRAADALAYKLNISRSALIDRILAEHLSVQTPETRMRSIMENFARFFDDEVFRLQATAGDGGMQIRSPLPYKYKPTIRYSVELLREGKYLGRLKVNFRTQNAALTVAMNDFWHYFSKLEARYLAEILDVISEIDNDKMVRMLNKPLAVDGRHEITADETAEAIADYIRFTDKMIKIYFEYADDRKTAAALLDSAYAERMKNCAVLV